MDKQKEPLTREDFVEIFELAWASTCQSDSSYIREVGVKQALLDEWSSLMDGLKRIIALRDLPSLLKSSIPTNNGQIKEEQ